MSEKSLPRSAVSHNTPWRGPDLAKMDAAFDRAFLADDGTLRKRNAWRLALVLLIPPIVVLGGLFLLIFGAVHPGKCGRRFCIPCQFGRHCGRCSCCS